MNDFRLFERGSYEGNAQDAITNLYDYSVISNEGKKIGKVEEIWLNDETGGEGFISVSTGWLFGRLCLVPVHSIEVDDTERVIRVPYSEDMVKGSPDVAADYHVTSEEAIVVKQYYGVDTMGGRMMGATTGTTDVNFAVDKDVDIDVTTTARMPNVDVSKTRITDSESTEIPLSEESVQIGKRQVQAGTVRLRKVVRTEIVNTPVELRREDVIIERVDPSEVVNTGTTDFVEGEIDIPLTREEVVVQKTTQVTGAVRARKVSDSESQTVSETVRKEDVEVDRDVEIDKTDITTTRTTGTTGITDLTDDTKTGKGRRK